MVFAKQPPKQRVLTLQLTNHTFIIPPRTKDYRVDVWGTLPNDCTLLSFFPHMHLRGQGFEYNILHPDGTVETLLRVNHYHFHWQLSYRLAEPRFLKAGTQAPGCCVVRQFRGQPAQSRSQCRGALGRADLRRDDGGLLRRGGPGEHG